MIPLVGCASHRLNLAMQGFLKQYEELINRVRSVMKKYMGVKLAAVLREREAKVKAKIDIVTR